MMPGSLDRLVALLWPCVSFSFCRFPFYYSMKTFQFLFCWSGHTCSAWWCSVLVGYFSPLLFSV